VRECRLLTSFTIMLTVCMHEPSIINRDAFVYLSLAVEMLRVCECVHACVYVCACVCMCVRVCVCATVPVFLGAFL